MEKILLIEDEELIIRLLGKKLASIGYDITLAMDGQEGLEKMRKNRPDLILLDIIMPRKGGFEVMEEMRKDPGACLDPGDHYFQFGPTAGIGKSKKTGRCRLARENRVRPEGSG